MFGRRWSWAVPLLGALVVFGVVLVTTPPGFRAISDVILGSPRGPTADAVAYTLGAASSLALLALLLLAGLTSLLELALRRWR
jgi:Mn2+/Fe2+ NRAMP family transporter